jgi:hypothetical protein
VTPTHTEAWDHLASYESRDVVSRLFTEAHGREPNAGKAKEMTSALMQAREYFNAFTAANDLVRPLLLYYGVLSLSRWLILFRERELRETSLYTSHGIGVAGWQNTFGEGGIEAFGTARVTVSANGTFSQLIEATRALESFTIPAYAEVRTRLFQKVTRLPIDGLSFTFRDIASRLHELSEPYAECFGESPRCRAAALTGGPGYVQLRFSKRPDESDLDVRSLFSIWPSAMLPMDGIDWQLVVHNAGPATTIEEVAPVLPPLGDASRQLFVREPLSSGNALSTLALLFAFSYTTGMLVRYFPSHWRAFLSRESGDAAIPVIQAGLRVVEGRFPELVQESAASLRFEWSAKPLPCTTTSSPNDIGRTRGEVIVG